MIDRNNLNRIKGILSAHLGAEIPKFTSGGIVEPDKLYSNHYLEWLKTLQNFSAPTDPEAQKLYQVLFPDKDLYANTTANTETLNGSKPSTTVVGAPEVTPTTLLENVAQTSKETSRTVIQLQALEAAKKAMSEAPYIKINNPNPEDEGLNNDKGDNSTGSDGNGNSAGTDGNTGDGGDTGDGGNGEGDDEKKSNWLKKAGKTVGEFGLNAGMQAFHGIGAALGVLQAATDSATTKNANMIYDLAAGIIEKMGPAGKAAGTAMKFADTAGNIIQGLGGGTDQMTGTDKWMDSSFFSWNIGMINGFGGKRADTFAADLDILASVGSSYGGTTEDINSAAAKSGKKYGLFSSSARKRANRQMADARAKLNLMGDISDEATNLRLAVLSMGELAGLAYSLMTDGGYNLKYTYAAKQGGVLEWNPIIELEWKPQIELNWELPEFKEGGSIDIQEELELIPEFLDNKPDFNIWFNSIPKQYRANGYDYKKAYEVFDWDLLSKHAKDPNQYHLYSVSPTPDENGNYPFLKLGKLNENPELKGEFDWYNSEAGKDHKAKFDIQYIGDRYYYVPKKFKNGGKTGESDIPEIEETTQKNVIPEGALHKNKHHMEHAEGLTKKGIPVIDEDGEQLAEIEHSEIIFTLEVTKKLEEYYDIFYSEESSNKEKEQAALDAGKLLVYQILENTEDRTGLIESCKKGGSLKLKTSTDDLIEEIFEWMPTIVVIENEEIKEEKPKEDKKKSEKELMKEAIKEVLIELLTK